METSHEMKLSFWGTSIHDVVNSAFALLNKEYEDPTVKDLIECIEHVAYRDCDDYKEIRSNVQ